MLNKLIILIDDDENSATYAAHELGIDKKYCIHINDFLKSKNYENYEKCYTIYSFATYNHEIITKLEKLNIKNIAFRSNKMKDFIKDLSKSTTISSDIENINKLKDIAFNENLKNLEELINIYENISADYKISWTEYLQNIILQIYRGGFNL